MADSELLTLVQKQAKDEGLWFIAKTAPEAYLQQELRALHAAIEGEAKKAEASSMVGFGSKDEVIQ